MKANLHREELIYKYLLGELSEGQEIEIEDQAFEDKALQRTISAVESDLIDDYLRGELTDLRKRQFELRFLASANRRKRVEFGAALLAVTQTALPATKPHRTTTLSMLSLRESIAALIQGLTPVARFAATAAVIVIVATAGWRLFRSNQESQMVTAKLGPPAIPHHDPVKPTVENDGRGPSAGDERQPPAAPVQKPLVRPAGPTSVSLALIAGISRSNEARPKLLIPSSARQVRLRIALDPLDDYEKYRLELRDRTGMQIYIKELRARTTPSGKTINLNLPARSLSSGSYEITVKGFSDQQLSDVIGYHYFDVVKSSSVPSPCSQ